MLHGRVDQVKLTVIENKQHYTTWETASTPKINKSNTENHLHQLGYVHHFDVWVPHKLTEKTCLIIFPYRILYLNVTKMFFF